MTKATTQPTPVTKTADLNKLAQNFSKIIEQSQRVLQEYLKRQERGDPISLIDPATIGKSFQELFEKLLKDPDKLIQAQVEFWRNYLDLWQTASKRILGHETQPIIAPPPSDKRFKDEQ